MSKLWLYFLLIGCCSYGSISAQQIIIDSVYLKGNRHTKDYILRFEVPIKKGDTLSREELDKQMLEGKNNLYRTNLFANIHVKDTLQEGEHSSVLISVKEHFRILPGPIFELEDDLGVWQDKYNFSLSRASYGLALYFNNLTGRRDRMSLKYRTGFNREYSFNYKTPFFLHNRLRTEVEYRHRNNKSINNDLFEGSETLYEGSDPKTFASDVGLVALEHRPTLRITQRLEYEYNHNTISDSLFLVSPDYLAGDKMDKFGALTYELKWDQLDNRFYPHAGYFFGLEMFKEGFSDQSVDNWFIYPLIAVFVPLTDKITLENQLHFSIGRAEGNYSYRYTPVLFEDNFFVRGYWTEVFKAYQHIHTKSSLHYKIYEKEFDFHKLIPFRSYFIIPFDAFLAANFDYAKVKDPFLTDQNKHYNKNLFGYGVGLNLMIYDQYTFMIELNRNNEGKTALEFGYRNIF